MNKNKLSVSRCGFLMLLLLVSCAPAVAQHTGDSLGGTFNNPAGATITKTIMDRIAQRNRERRLAARRSGAGLNCTTFVVRISATGRETERCVRALSPHRHTTQNARNSKPD